MERTGLSPQKDGMYRDLMMPGFTDAGAGTVYAAKTAIPRRTAATKANISSATTHSSSGANNIDSDDNDTDDAIASVEESFSEANTELHNNCTNKGKHNIGRPYLLKSNIVRDSRIPNISNKNNKNIHSKDHTYNMPSCDNVEVEATFGFFPSTKPPMSPSLHSIGRKPFVGGENKIYSNEKLVKSPGNDINKLNTPPCPSPQPISPPLVTRKQLMAVKRSSSTTAVVEDENNRTTDVGTKTREGDTRHIIPKLDVETDSEKSPKDENDSKQVSENIEQTQHYEPLHDLPFPTKMQMKREVSTFSLAPETGAVVDREEHQAKLKHWKEVEASNQMQTQKDDSHSHPDGKTSTPTHEESQPQRIEEMEEHKTESGSGIIRNDTRDSIDKNDARNCDEMMNRRLDLNALQELDRMDNQEKTRVLQPCSEESEELSTSSSIVSSTCSEFGTVIQMGAATMAARIKEVEEMESAALADAQSEIVEGTKESQLSTSLLQHEASLDLPILELPSSCSLDAASTNSGELRVELQTKQERENQQSDAKTNVASANSTVNPGKLNPTRSEMISAAFRRIGPIHRLKNNVSEDKDIRKTLSAPTTPMRFQPPHRSKQPMNAVVEGREILPSRYETASDVGEDQTTRILSPRFASFLSSRGKPTNNQKVAAHHLSLSHRMDITQTIQNARKRFSTDNTRVDDRKNDYDRGSDFNKNDRNFDDSSRQVKEDLVIPPLGHRSTIARLAPRVLPLESSSSVLSGQGTTFSGPLRYTRSLDSSNDGLSFNKKLPSPTKESQRPQRIEIEREDALDILACLVEQGVADWGTSSKIPKTYPASTMTESRENFDANGTSVDSEKNISHNKARSSSSKSSSLPPSIDVITAEKEEKSEEATSKILPASKEKAELENSTIHHDHGPSDSAFSDIINDFHDWIKEGDEDNEVSVGGKHTRPEANNKIAILQELIESHAYAVEMKRASASASAWLKSIGRGRSTIKPEISSNVIEMRDHNLLKTSSATTGVQSENEDNLTRKLDVLTLRASLHNSQLELSEVKECNLILNEELSKCRAEIGRMKSISRGNHLNKSVFDNSEKSSDTSSTECRSNIATERIGSAGQSDVINLRNALEKANETILRLHSDLNKNNPTEKKENADKAPVVDIPEIRSDHTQIQSSASNLNSSNGTTNGMISEGENFVTDWDDLRALPPPPDHSLQSPIVSAILEQWTQDHTLHESLLSWIDNVMKSNNLEDLPPLTLSSLDHQVRDGLIMHVLPHLLRRADIHVSVQTRTHRKTTYDMSITVSQKSEFMTEMSQPPSLLDRRDSMSGDEWVNRFEPRLSSADSVAHSAVTETVANIQRTPKNQYTFINDTFDQIPRTPVGTQYNEISSQLRARSGSSDIVDENSRQYRQRQSELKQANVGAGTIMGALGGALSGLLSRNKHAGSPGGMHSSQTHHLGTIGDAGDSSNILPATLRAQIDLTSSPTTGSNEYHRMPPLEATVSVGTNDQRQYNQEEPQPYHRVVSAPPGRIGLTFVEFRGHAMVSDVATDSPLAGWVFPSDILIACDEIPVSGMRVRDIVTILSNRKNQQRAMRVISSHAMNEFTMMSQVGGSLTGDGDENE